MEVFSGICLPSFRQIQFNFSENFELLDAYLNSIKHLEGHLLQTQPKTSQQKLIQSA